MSVRSKDGQRRARRHSFTSLEEVARTVEASTNAQIDVRKRSRSPCAEGAGNAAKKPATAGDVICTSNGDDYLCLPSGREESGWVWYFGVGWRERSVSIAPGAKRFSW